MLTFVKDYKNDDGLRQSFDALAKNTFGISFDVWYQNGCWDDNYISYSFQDAGKIVANASANRMTLKMEGVQETVSAIQIGTVMTDPAYRRKGLAHALMQKIFEDFDAKVSLYFLAADRDAMPLYEKCGFVEVAETCYHYELQKSSTVEQTSISGKIISSAHEPFTLTKTTLSLEEFLHWKRSAMPKGCAFDVEDDAHIAAFYWFHGIKDMLFKLGDDCLVIADFTEDGRKMTLYDYYVLDTQSLDTQALDTIIKAIEQLPNCQIEQIHFAFDVTGMQLRGPLVSHVEEKSGWMTRSQSELHFPEVFCYPKLAQA